MISPRRRDPKPCDWPGCGAAIPRPAYNARWCSVHRKSAKNRSIRGSRKKLGVRLQGTRSCASCRRTDHEVTWNAEHPSSRLCGSCERRKVRNGECRECRRPMNSVAGAKGCPDCWPGVSYAEQERARGRRGRRSA